MVRSHIGLAYFFPRRAFADFFGMERWPPKPRPPLEDDIHAIDFSSESSYDQTEWAKCLDHMNTHLFHLNYARVLRTPPSGFDSANTIRQIHPEFVSNWAKFIGGLRGDFPRLFREQIDARARQPENRGLPFCSG